MKSDILQTEVVYDEFLTIEKSRLRWEQFDGSMGGERVRYVVRRGDSVGIVARCERCDRIVLVKQFRYPAVRNGDDGFLWEIPAGMMDDGEDPEETARRELQEETGEEGMNFERLFMMYLSPGVLDERMHLFRCSIPECDGLASIGGRAAEHENLLIGSFGNDEITAMIREGTIRDSKTIAAFLSLRLPEQTEGD